METNKEGGVGRGPRVLGGPDDWSDVESGQAVGLELGDGNDAAEVGKKYAWASVGGLLAGNLKNDKKRPMDTLLAGFLFAF